VLNPLDYLPLIPHNPQRDGCSHIVYSPVSSKNPAGYTVSGMSAIPLFRREALKSQKEARKKKQEKLSMEHVEENRRRKSTPLLHRPIHPNIRTALSSAAF
jgi:hypothetical protein